MTRNSLESMRVRVGDKITILPRGKKGIWSAEFYHAGQHRHRSLKTANLKIARQRATILEGELAGGDYAAPTKPSRIADAVKVFMTSKKAEGRAYKTPVKYQDELDAFCDALGGQNIRTLQQITATAFDRLPWRAARRGDRPRPSTPAWSSSRLSSSGSFNAICWTRTRS